MVLSSFLLRYRSSSQIDVQYFAARAVSFRPIFQVSTVVVVGSSILGPFAMTTVRDNYHTGPVRDDNSFILFPTYIDHGLWT